jgi:CHAT domain-containing protein/tetratricopeptide (TPR) repeat protein
MAETLPHANDFVPCPHCDEPMRGPDHLIISIDYPTDLNEIEQLFAGALNCIRHRCGSWVCFSTDLCVENTESGALVTTIANDELAKIDRIRVVESLTELVDVVSSWVTADTGPFIAATQSDSFADLAPEDRIDLFSPIVLLAMKLARDGVLTFRVAAPPDMIDTADQWVHDFAVALTAKHVLDLVDAVSRRGDLKDLIEEITDRVPARCFDEDVLTALNVRAEEALAGGSEVMELYQILLSGSVAHLLAGRANPQDQAFADHLCRIHVWASNPDVDLDPSVWIIPEVLSRLVSPSATLEAAANHIPQGLLSRESLEFVAKLGHLDAFNDVASHLRFSFGDDSRPSAEFLDVLISIAAKNMLGSGDADAQWSFGKTTGAMAIMLVESLPDGEAFDVLGEVDGRVRDHGHLPWVGYRVGTCEAANLRQRPILAVWAIEDLDALLADVPPDKGVAIFNEAGNTARYFRAFDHALNMYSAAAEINEEFVRDPVRALSLRHNVGIVLRDRGELGKALRVFEALLPESPEVWGLADSLVALYVQVGRPSAAQKLLDEVLGWPSLSPANAHLARRRRGVARAMCGDVDGALDDLELTLHALPPGPPDVLRLEVLSALQWISSDGDEGVRMRLDAHAIELLNVAPHVAEQSALRALAGLVPLLLRRLEDRDEVSVRSTVLVCNQMIDSHGLDSPWQVVLAEAWLSRATNPARAGSLVLSALVHLDQLVPTNAEAAWALSWVGRRDVVAAQRVATELGLDSAHARDPELLVAAYDLGNGRELLSTASRHAVVPGVSEAMTSLRRVQAELGADLVSVIDASHGCRLLVQPLDGAPTVVELANLDVVTRAARALRYMSMSNPVTPEDRLTTLWWELADTFARCVRRLLPEPRPLVVLPGARLNALPFHAAGWREHPLIAERHVVQAVSHRMLAASPALRDDESFTVVACEKAGEQIEFRDRLHTSAKVVSQRSPSGAPGKLIVGATVTEPRLVEAFATSREIAVLCHGIAAVRADEGPGLCVGADGLLPPQWMPVVDDPALHAFVVSWLDLSTLSRTPETVVSIACSSGITGVGVGGTRLGLDQALTANSTRHLISPLWNIAQEPALEWVDSFYGSRFGTSTVDVMSAYRDATLAVRSSWPHPYHWAPFALNIAFQGAPT